jgi:ribosome-binding protein aMBF1 (putative translation factor)
MSKEHLNLKSWAQIKDDVYGKKRSPRRDELDREVEAFKIGILIRQARESKKMTQEELGKVISKKRSYISRIENDGSNMNLKTLYDIVEKGLGGKVNIAIEI